MRLLVEKIIVQQHLGRQEKLWGQESIDMHTAEKVPLLWQFGLQSRSQLGSYAAEDFRWARMKQSYWVDKVGSHLGKRQTVQWVMGDGEGGGVTCLYYGDLYGAVAL